MTNNCPGILAGHSSRKLLDLVHNGGCGHRFPIDNANSFCSSQSHGMKRPDAFKRFQIFHCDACFGASLFPPLTTRSIIRSLPCAFFKRSSKSCTAASVFSIDVDCGSTSVCNALMFFSSLALFGSGGSCCVASLSASFEDALLGRRFAQTIDLPARRPLSRNFS